MNEAHRHTSGHPVADDLAMPHEHDDHTGHAEHANEGQAENVKEASDAIARFVRP
ncbi:hypothetical protein ACFO6V_01715 [Promicromonospora alba]|uniref:Uncharacterized protein n=1 Tax=Promicromonospora alba TaxID=1616110 RepID=A0ABV9HBE9_9MICO